MPRVYKAIEGLREESRPPGRRKLSDRAGWRLRVSVYRVFYDVDDDNES